jgi:hypothetical protein
MDFPRKNFLPRLHRGSPDGKNLVKKILLTTSALVLVSGFTLSVGYGSSSSRNSDRGDSSREFRPPQKGETQAQVKAQYDEPDQVLKNSKGGDIWVYVFGKDKILGNEKLFVPSDGLIARVRVLSVRFNPIGRVTSWKTAFITFSKSPLISF